MTARRALKALEAQGAIVAEPRKGYRVLARAHHPGRGCPLALVLSADRTEWNALDRQLVDKFQAFAADQGRSVLTVSQAKASPEEVAQQILAARSWGALLRLSDSRLAGLLSKVSMPMLSIESWLQGVGIDAVIQDSYTGAMLAASYLAEKGHERIGWLGFAMSRHDPPITERYSGAVGGLAQVNRRLADDLCEFVPRHSDAQLEQAAARRLLSRPDRPTAILALWQPLAEALVRAAGELGLVPGRDFGMVGWCTREDYESMYRPLFGKGPVQPAVTWSLATLVQIALARIEERRSRPDLPAINLKVPAELRTASIVDVQKERNS